MTDTLKGILWMLSTTFFFTCMMLVVRFLSADLSTPQIVFVRSVVGTAIFLPILMRGASGGFRTDRWLLYTLRAAVLVAGSLCLFEGIALLPFSDVVALHFTVPLWTVLAAILILREAVSWPLGSATLIGFLGTLVIIRPGAGVLDAASLLVLASAMFYALDNVIVKLLGRTEPTVRVVFYMHIASLAFSFGISVFDWRPLTWDAMPMILVLGVFSSLAHVSLTRAYALARASVVTPFSFVRLPISAAASFYLFGERTDIWTWVGAAIIFGATLYLARREGRQPDAARPRQPAGAGG